MVLFNNIRVGQEVEVYWRNRIWAGKVQYAGPVFGREGNWVGVELKKPAGYCNGNINGRCYFTCLERHGIFVTADKIRYRPMATCLRGGWKTICPNSEIDEELFGYPQSETMRLENEDLVKDSYVIPESYYEKIRDFNWQEPPSHESRFNARRRPQRRLRTRSASSRSSSSSSSSSSAYSTPEPSARIVDVRWRPAWKAPTSSKTTQTPRGSRLRRTSLDFEPSTRTNTRPESTLRRTQRNEYRQFEERTSSFVPRRPQSEWGGGGSRGWVLREPYEEEDAPHTPRTWKPPRGVPYSYRLEPPSWFLSPPTIDHYREPYELQRSHVDSDRWPRNGQLPRTHLVNNVEDSIHREARRGIPRLLHCRRQYFAKRDTVIPENRHYSYISWY